MIARRSMVMGIMAMIAGGTKAAASSLEGFRWRRRLVVAFAPDAGDPNLLVQRSLASDPGFAERDLDLIEVIGGSPVTVNGAADPDLDAAALRQRFGASGERFQAFLVGKDGGVKRSGTDPLRDADLYPLIDSMPMRQREMRERGG